MYVCVCFLEIVFLKSSCLYLWEKYGWEHSTELAEIFESESEKWLSCGIDIFSEYLYLRWVLGFRHVQRGTLEVVYLKSGLFRKADLELEVFLGGFP